MSDNEERIIELLTEANNHLDRIEVLLDLLTAASEDTAASASITAYRSLGFFGRLRADWHNAGHIIAITEQEAEQGKQHHDLH